MVFGAKIWVKILGVWNGRLEMGGLEAVGEDSGEGDEGRELEVVGVGGKQEGC